jgi:hypothetical protein
MRKRSRLVAIVVAIFFAGLAVRVARAVWALPTD